MKQTIKYQGETGDLYKVAIQPQTIVLDIDDFSVLRSRWDLLTELKEHFPKLKLSLFTIPWDFEYETSEMKLLRDKMLKRLKENLDWIQIIPHGLSHIGPPQYIYGEFEKSSREDTKIALKAIEDVFNKDGIPFVHGFKAPFWLWNQDVVDVMDEYGWFGAIDRNQPNMLCTKKFYVYNWDIIDPFPKDLELVKGHGHMTLPSKNNLSDCFLNLMKMPTDTEFAFVTDCLEEKK